MRFRPVFYLAVFLCAVATPAMAKPAAWEIGSTPGYDMGAAAFKDGESPVTVGRLITNYYPGRKANVAFDTEVKLANGTTCRIKAPLSHELNALITDRFNGTGTLTCGSDHTNANIYVDIQYQVRQTLYVEAKILTPPEAVLPASFPVSINYKITLKRLGNDTGGCTQTVLDLNAAAENEFPVEAQGDCGAIEIGADSVQTPQ